MKQMRLSMVAGRFISLLLIFFMIASFDGMAQTTHSVGSTSDWNNAISSLGENDIIQLTANVTMDDLPAVACTVTSDDGQKTLTYGNELEMTAPLTFSNIKLNMSCIYANGHALVFDDGVECTATYNGSITGLRTVWGGSKTGSVACTSVTLKSGTFGWVYGGGNQGSVTGEARLELSETVQVNGAVFGGGDAASAGCGSTHVEVSGGTYGFINGGGYSGDVTGECYLKISGTPTITGNVFGGSNQKTATVGSTRVEVSGGTFKDGSVSTIGGSIFAGGWGCTVNGNTSLIATGGTIGSLYGGCSQGSVHGATYVEVNGATLDGGMQSDNVTPNSAVIYGGGFGDDNSADGYDADKGKVGSTRVVVKSLTPGTAGVILYGGGLYAGVTGNTDVTIEDGTFTQVWGSSYTQSTVGTQYQGVVGGNVNVLVKGGTIDVLGAARDQIPGEVVPVVGTMNLTIEGGTITQQIGSGNHPSGNGYKPCTLTIRNLGSSASPYDLPEIYAMTNLVLDKSTVTTLAPGSTGSSAIILHSVVVDEDNPMTISGDGKLVGSRIILSNFRAGSLPVDVPLVIGTKQLVDASFVAYEGPGDGTIGGLSTLPIYKVGDTYRKTEMVGGAIPNEVKAKTVTITSSSHGKLTVVWSETGRSTTLENGDQVPVNTELTLSVSPNAGYQGGIIYVDGIAFTGTTYQITGDVTISAGNFTEILPPTPDPDPVYYTVTLPAIEGAIIDPIAGDYAVESWSSFRFYLTLDKEYDKSEPVVTTSRGETIQPRISDDAYIIKYVRSDVEVFIDGIVKNPDPVANTKLQSGIKVWTNDHRLFIRTDQPEDVVVYTFGGELRRTFRSKGGDEAILLSAGSYVVCIGKKSFKVVL